MAMEYSDDDEFDEDFQFDAGSAFPRYAVSSCYQQLYSSHGVAPGVENNDDDGWNSDDETCLPDLPQQEGI